MQKVLLHELYSNLISTLIILIIITLSYLVANLLAAKKMDSARQKQRFRIRSLYVSCIVFLFLMARVWVEGFTHLLAVLGLVSAALVVTNKETIMNFAGWFIINWRGLFSEDDLIQLQQHKGYIKSIGFLYFTLSEVSDSANGHITGRVIRIPNGLVANNALINFSQTSHLLEQKFSIMVHYDSDLEYAVHWITELVNKTIAEFYSGKREYSMEYLNKRNRQFTNRICLTAKTLIEPKPEKLAGIELITRYYCFSEDSEKIQQKIWLTLLQSIKHETRIQLP